MPREQRRNVGIFVQAKSGDAQLNSCSEAWERWSFLGEDAFILTKPSSNNWKVCVWERSGRRSLVMWPCITACAPPMGVCLSAPVRLGFLPANGLSTHSMPKEMSLGSVAWLSQRAHGQTTWVFRACDNGFSHSYFTGEREGSRRKRRNEIHWNGINLHLNTTKVSSQNTCNFSNLTAN